MFVTTGTLCVHVQLLNKDMNIPNKEDVVSHLTAAAYVLFTVPTVWFHYLVATVLCY